MLLRKRQTIFYCIFTYANTAERQLAARSLKDEHSRQGYFSAQNAVLKDR